MEDKWLGIGLDLDPQFLIAGMQVRRSQAPLESGESNLSLAEIAQLLERELAARVAR